MKRSCVNLFRGILILVNCILIGFGLTICIWGLNNIGAYQNDYFPASVNNFLFFPVGLSIFTILLATLGIFGAYWEKRSLIIPFVVILSILVLFEIGCGVLAISAYGLAKDAVRYLYIFYINTVNSNGDRSLTTLLMQQLRNYITLLQANYRCCGIHESGEYKEPEKYCCFEASECQRYPPQQGCIQYVDYYIDRNAPIVAAYFLGVGFAELFVLIGAIIMLNQPVYTRLSASSSTKHLLKF